MEKSDPLSLKQSIYLGDRAIKLIILDGWNELAKVQVDSISRVRSADGKWDYYTAEDIEDGFLVFGNVRLFAISPTGAIPKDYVTSFELNYGQPSNEVFRAHIVTAGVLPTGERGEIAIEVVGDVFYLEDPNRPGEKIPS